MRHVAGLAALLASLLGTTLVAQATPCPAVMIVLDTSGSMSMAPDGSMSTPTKLDLAKTAITTLLGKYGDQLPFGYTTFTGNPLLGCTMGITIQTEPMHGTKADITGKVAAQTAGGGTNTGEAIDRVSADPKMHDAMRPGAYIILITDGAPTCNAGDNNGTGPATFTTARIDAAAKAGVKTFVIGFGALGAQESMNMDAMAQAGQEPCSGAACTGGHQYYVADSGAQLTMLLDSIANQIGSGEFNNVACDDTCYGNGCPTGQICVGAMCKPDPCVGINCGTGQYCYTDGTSPGKCVGACNMTCGAGQICSTSGQCVADSCAQVSCPAGQACANGACIVDQCTTAGCAPGLTCYHGQCLDDPCRFVHCPANATCVSGSGACASGDGGNGLGGGTPHARGQAGCSISEAGAPAPAALMFLCMLAAWMWRRRCS
jgi:hypothetical protein